MAQRKKSNMQKNFEKHAEGGLRCMADGGLVPPKKPGLIESIGTTLQNAMPMPQVPAANIPQPLNTFQPTQPGKLPVKSGNPMPRTGSPLPSTASVPVRAADGGEIVKQFGLRAALRSGEAGRVVGPGGPREDKVHAKLSAGEYVLPAKTVEAMGGAEALDAYVRETNDGREPNPTLRMAGGGMVPYNPIVGQAPGPVVQPAAQPQQFPASPLRAGPNPNVSPVEGSKEMRDFMASNPRVQGGGSPLPAAKPVTPAGPPRLTGALVAAPTAIFGAKSSFDTPTSEYRSRLGMDPNEGSVGGDLVARGAGVVSDFGANMLDIGTGLVNGVRNMGGAAPLESFNSILKRDDKGAGVTPPAAAPSLRTPMQPAAAMPPRSEVWQEDAGSNPFANIKGFDANTGLITRSNIPGDASATTIDENGNPVRTDGQQQRVAIVGTNDPGSRQTMQTVEGRQATLRAAYAPTQYRDEPSTNPALRRDDLHAGANFGDSGGINNPNSWDWMATRKDRRMAQEREANQNNNATLRRGQDMSYAGDAAKANALTQKANIDAASEASKAQRDQANKDREFNAAQKKQTAEEGRAQQTARAQASETQRKDIESRFRMKDGDGKDVPDTARAASYYAAAAKTLPAMITALRAQGSPEALAKAQVLTEKGVGALEPGDHDQLTDLFNRRDQMSKAAGIGPNQGTYKHSDNLLDYMQVQGPKGVEKRVFGGNRVNTPAGSVSVNDLKYKDGPANRILPDWFKTQNIDGTRGLRTE